MSDRPPALASINPQALAVLIREIVLTTLDTHTIERIAREEIAARIGIITPAELAHQLGYKSIASAERTARRLGIPKVKLTPGHVGYPVADLQAAIAERTLYPRKPKALRNSLT